MSPFAAPRSRQHQWTTRHRAPQPVQYVQIRVPGGGTVLGAASRSHAGVVYALEHLADGRLRCACPAYKWRGTCAHVEGARP